MKPQTLWTSAVVAWLLVGQAVLALHLEKAAGAGLMCAYAAGDVLVLGGLILSIGRWRSRACFAGLGCLAALTGLTLFLVLRPSPTWRSTASPSSALGLPSYEFYGSLLELVNNTHLPAEQAACILSILRQGPAQYDAGATARFAAAYDAAVGSAAATFQPSMVTATDEDLATPPGRLLMEALTRVSTIAGQDWKNVPLPESAGGQLQAVTPGGAPMADRLRNVIALAEAGKLSKAQAQQLLPPLVGLVDAADYSCKHLRAVEDQLNPEQVRFVLDTCRTAKTPPFASIGEVFSRMTAAGYKLIGGEAPTIEGADRTALSVPYNDLLWGVAWLDASGPEGLTPLQARQIDAVIRRLMVWSLENRVLYTAVVGKVEETLRPEQWQFVTRHQVSPEEFARTLVTATPAGADVIGYAFLRLLEGRAGVHAFALPAASVSGDAEAPAAALNPGSCFAAILMMEKEPSLAITPEQARALLPYVRAASRANDVNHLVKEQIGDVLREDQRQAIMKALAARGPLQQMVDPKDVVAGLERRLGKSVQ